MTKYIIQQLVIPKRMDNRELQLIGKGNYAAPVTGDAQAVGLSMDGFCTLLEDMKTAGDSNVNFISLEDLTTTNIFDEIEKFAAGIAELYQDIPMKVFLSRAWYSAYHKKRRDLHGADNNYEGAKDLIEGTNLTLTPLPSMNGKSIIFTTPKENFIRLLNRNKGASKIEVENVDRLIKIYGDWHESVGFGIEEAIFAYVPSEASASE